MVTLMWELIAKIGLWALDTFIKEWQKRERLKSSFLEFVANRKNRADMTVAIKEQYDAQVEELERIRKEELENAKESVPGGTKDTGN